MSIEKATLQLQAQEVNDFDAQIEGDLKRLDDNFAELTKYLETLDNDEGTSFIPAIAAFTPAQLMDKLKAIENFALNLGFEEAR